MKSIGFIMCRGSLGAMSLALLAVIVTFANLDLGVDATLVRHAVSVGVPISQIPDGQIEDTTASVPVVYGTPGVTIVTLSTTLYTTYAPPTYGIVPGTTHVSTTVATNTPVLLSSYTVPGAPILPTTATSPTSSTVPESDSPVATVPSYYSAEAISSIRNASSVSTVSQNLGSSTAASITESYISMGSPTIVSAYGKNTTITTPILSSGTLTPALPSTTKSIGAAGFVTETNVGAIVVLAAVFVLF